MIRFIAYKKQWRNYQLNAFRVRKRRYLPHFLSDKSFVYVVHPAFLSLHGGSLEITLTVPLNAKFVRYNVQFFAICWCMFACVCVRGRGVFLCEGICVCVWFVEVCVS